MAFNVGINVVEVDGAAAPSITGAATSVAGFAVLTERGVRHQPTRVSSFPQFVERFGGFVAGAKGAYLVRGFFDNGGQVAYVSRIVDPAAEPASHTFNGPGNRAALKVEAAFRGEADPGSWGRRLFVRIIDRSSATSRLRETARATVSSGSALAATTDLSTERPALSVKVDGDSRPTVIEFRATDFADVAQATRQEIVTRINAATNLLSAKLASDNKLVLTSTGERAALSGTPTSLQVDKANAKLGFTVMSDPVSGAVDRPGESGTVLATPGTFTVGDAIVLKQGTKEKRTVLTSVDPITGAVTYNPKLTALGDFDEPGAVVVSNVEFDLVVAHGAGDDDHVVETHTGLSLQRTRANYAPSRLNHPLTGSRFVRLRHPDDADADRPTATTSPKWQPLDEGGVDGAPTAAHFIGGAAAHTGFSAFDAYDIQLLCSERDDVAVALAASAYCAGRGDAMFVGAVPQGLVASLQDAIAYGRQLQETKSYGALYGPWIVVPDPVGVGDDPRIAIPPTGHVMGVFARTETTRGIWKAPAGDEATLRGVLDVETRFSDTDHTALVTDGCINGIRPVPRAGIVVDASRTLSTDPRWRYVNVRLLFNFVKSSLRDGLRWARQEPNRDALWRSIRVSTVTPFLLGLWRQGAFGTGSPEQTFTVIVDETNNPPDQVEQGRLTVEVYFYPSRPAETVVIFVGQQASGASVSEA